MIMLIKTLAAVASGTVLATNAFAQSTREVRDVSPYFAIENESPPKLIVDPTPPAAGLAHDIVWIQYHAENVRIVPVFGQARSTYLHENVRFWHKAESQGVAVIAENISAMFAHQLLASPRPRLLLIDLSPMSGVTLMRVQ